MAKLSLLKNNSSNMDSSAETLIITSCADVSIRPLVLNIRSWVFLFVYCFVWDKFIMCVLCAFHFWYDLFAVIEVYKNTFGIVNTIYKSYERPFFLQWRSYYCDIRENVLFSQKTDLLLCLLFSANSLKIWLERYLL